MISSQARSPAAALEDEPSGLSFEAKLVMYGVGAPVVIALSFLIWFFAIRDTWESDHRFEITRLSDEIRRQVQAGKLADGVESYDEVLRLLGDRKLNDPDLRKAVADARETAASATRNLQEEQRLAEKRQEEERRLAEERQEDAAVVLKVRGLAAQAKVFVVAGDFERGIEKYEQALDVINGARSQNPELEALITEISQAKASTSLTLHQKRKDDEAERKRIEEQKRLASVRVNIKGGSWLTRNLGNSEPIRGLNISLIRSRGTNHELFTMLQATSFSWQTRLAVAKEVLGSAIKMLARTKEYFETNSSSKAINELNRGYIMEDEKRVRMAEEAVDSAEQSCRSLQDKLLQVSKLKQSDSVDVAAIYALLPTSALKSEADAWSLICSQLLVASTHTDVEGRYRIEAPAGDYRLYAMFESSYFKVEWFVPVNISESGDIVIDLYNDNAARITNITK